MPLLWRNQFWQSLEEGAGKRCSECGLTMVTMWMHDRYVPGFMPSKRILRRLHKGLSDEVNKPRSPVCMNTYEKDHKRTLKVV